jgi:hypothetical protein
MYSVNIYSGQIKRFSDGVVIPADDRDLLWQDYAAWLTAGGTPLEVDEPPPPSVPSEIQMWQARAILSRAGLLGQVEQAVKAATNPEIEIAWEYAPNVVRQSAFVSAMAAAINLDNAAIDNLFIEGAKIR